MNNFLSIINEKINIIFDIVILILDIFASIIRIALKEYTYFNT